MGENKTTVKTGYREVMFADESVALLSKDGLMYLFEREEAIKLLKGHVKDSKGWYFNKTKDRLCGVVFSLDTGYVCINPSIVNETLGLPVI